MDNLFERSIFATFDEWNSQKQVDLINKLIERSKNTYFEFTPKDDCDEEIKHNYSCLRFIRKHANLHKKPTTVAYLQEIRARALYLIQQCSVFGRLTTHRDINFFYFDNEVPPTNKIQGSQEFSVFSMNAINSISRMLSQMEFIHLMGCGEYHAGEPLDQNKVKTIDMTDLIYESEEDFNRIIKEILHLEPFHFRAIHRERSLLHFSVMYNNKRELFCQYETFAHNLQWLKEHSHYLMSSQSYCYLFLQKEEEFFQGYPQYDVHLHDCTAQDFWSDMSNSIFNIIDITDMQMAKFITDDQLLKTDLTKLLLLDQTEMIQRLQPYM